MDSIASYNDTRNNCPDIIPRKLERGIIIGTTVQTGVDSVARITVAVSVKLRRKYQIVDNFLLVGTKDRCRKGFWYLPKRLNITQVRYWVSIIGTAKGNNGVSVKHALSFVQDRHPSTVILEAWVAPFRPVC